MAAGETRDDLATRVTLLARVREAGDSASWREFYSLYQALVYRVARRSGLSHEEAEEVRQDVFIRVTQTIGEFEARAQPGSFRAWLMNLTRWKVTDKLRERGRQPRRHESARSAEQPGRTRTIERVPDGADLERGWDEEWRAHLIDAAMARIAPKAKPAHFQAFELCTRQNWPAAKAAKKLGISLASVYVINHRLGGQLKTELKHLSAALG